MSSQSGIEGRRFSLLSKVNYSADTASVAGRQATALNIRLFHQLVRVVSPIERIYLLIFCFRMQKSMQLKHIEHVKTKRI